MNDMQHKSPTAAGAPRWMKGLLVVSLAVNLLVAGLAVGQWAGGPPDRADRSGPRGASMALGPLGRALSQEDRRAIAESLRGDRETFRSLRQARAARQAQIVEILQAETFDRAALATLLEVQRTEGGALAARGQDALLDRLEIMSAEERAAFAERLANQKTRGRPKN